MQEAVENDKVLDQKHMMLEFASFSDGKEAVAKAANLLFVKSLTSKNSSGDQEDEIFTEPHMTEALRAVGLFYFAVVLNGFENWFCFRFNVWPLGIYVHMLSGSGGPETDLLLVYGPARCHQGYPAWRIPYTEIVWVFSLIVYIFENTSLGASGS